MVTEREFERRKNSGQWSAMMSIGNAMQKTQQMCKRLISLIVSGVLITVPV